MIDGAGAAIANGRSSTKPDEPAETELRTFHAAFDSVPWSEVTDTLDPGARRIRRSSFGRGRRICCWLARLDQRDLAPGEQQFLLMLTTRGLATQVDSAGSPYWLLNAETHASLLESLAERGLPLRTSRAATA